MSIHKTEAIVINKFDFRETSIIANFYTRDFGKISGLLKGIRKEPKKFASTLEPFSFNEIIFYRKINSSLHLVSQCDIRNNFFGIRRDMLKSGAGGIITELLHAVMPQEDINEEVFKLTLDVLHELEVNPEPDKVSTIFKIKILALSGFKPHFDSCVSCDAKILGQSKFSVLLGGLLCPQCCGKDLTARPIFRGTVASILHIERSPFRNALMLGMNPQIKRELGFVLTSFLNFHLGKKLKSESVVDTLKAFSLVANGGKI
ncbi:MAG: DNA repair protein RecO [Candidatus Omnitrophota bacterium]